AAAAGDRGGRGRGRPRTHRGARRRRARGGLSGRAGPEGPKKAPGGGHVGGGRMRSGYLGLGSNVGDREAHLRAAIELLRERGIEVEAISSTYETEPVGEVLDQPDFLNAAVRIHTYLEPEDLLDVCKEVEVARGRTLD